MLNEACSSGCGSFIETFAKSMGVRDRPISPSGGFSPSTSVDLGVPLHRLYELVGQAGPEGRRVGRRHLGRPLPLGRPRTPSTRSSAPISPDELGQHIVVQGGTFLNDAVLRSFEREIGRDVIRPNIAGLMGAFGAALYGKAKRQKESTILSLEELENFTHTAKSVTCKGCANHCPLTVNTFSDGGRFISGNKCEKPLGIKNAEKAAGYLTNTSWT